MHQLSFSKVNFQKNELFYDKTKTMKTIEKTMITVTTAINAPVEKVWFLWTDPKHIVHWNNASDDWHTPRAENDLRVGGRFLSRMEARDGTQGFDFTGEYRKVVLNKQIFYRFDDDREVRISFSSNGNETTVTETFEVEHDNTVELQRSGWQSILDNFKKYVETTGRKGTMHFEIAINANAEKVYKTMLDEKGYTEWTSVFNPTSHFLGSWEKGSEIRFLGTDKDGNIGGMISKIKENIPNTFVSIEHHGIVQDGKAITGGPEVNMWKGSLENYTLTSEKEKTLLLVDLISFKEFDKQFKSYFSATWPLALNKLKAICEA